MSEVAPGWYAGVSGEKADLDDWRALLSSPFEPTAILLPDGQTALRSSTFDHLESAEEVRERAISLIGRLNGVLWLCRRTDPVIFSGYVMRFGSDGQQGMYVFPGPATADLGRFQLRANLTLLGLDGQPIKLDLSQQSQAQAWNEIAAVDDNLSDLLDHLGRSDNWFDIYKTIELAEDMAGGERKLAKLLGDGAKDAKAVKTCANYYRHARAHRPKVLMSVYEARRHLTHIARVLMARATRA